MLLNLNTEMDEINPLEPTTLTLPKRCLQNNIRGRPSADKAVRFTPQPKSIVSRLLRRPKEHDCDNEVKIIGSYSNISKSKSQTQNYGHIKHNSKQEDRKLTNTYKVQGSFTLDLTTIEDDCDSVKDTLIDGDQKSVQKNTNIPCNKKCEAEKMLPEIQCYICTHRSDNHQAHRKHLGTHRNQPYACNFPNCQYTCKLSCNLIKHKRIHTSEKPFLCDQCTFRSNFANSLKVHKRIHTSERPYGCQHCSYRCNSSSNLKKHCRHKHRNIS